MSEPDKIISVVGTCCPLPLIGLAKAVEDMQAGQVLSVIGDDPLFESGVRDYCQARGFEVLDVSEQSETVTLRIRA